MHADSPAIRIEVNASSSAPAYVTSLANYQIARITNPTNGQVSLNNVLPTAWQNQSGLGNNNSIMGQFSGGASDSTGRRMIVHGGGHTDSACNGLFYYDWNGVSAPTGWVLVAITPPGSIQANTDPQSDGNPLSVHTYASGNYDPNTNRYFRWQGSQYNSGGTDSKNWQYRFGTGWVQSPNSPAAALNANGAVTLLDSVQRKIWISSHTGDWYFHRIDTNTAGAVGSGLDHSLDGVAAYDTSRSRGIIQAPSQLTLATPNWSAETVSMSRITTASGATGALTGRGPVLFYDSVTDHYWLLPLTDSTTSMPTVYDIHPTSWLITAHTTSGATTGYGTNGWTGCYNKFCWMPDWRAIAFGTGINDAAYIMKLPSTLP